MIDDSPTNRALTRQSRYLREIRDSLNIIKWIFGMLFFAFMVLAAVAVA